MNFLRVDDPSRGLDTYTSRVLKGMCFDDMSILCLCTKAQIASLHYIGSGKRFEAIVKWIERSGNFLRDENEDVVEVARILYGHEAHIPAILMFLYAPESYRESVQYIMQHLTNEARKHPDRTNPYVTLGEISQMKSFLVTYLQSSGFLINTGDDLIAVIGQTLQIFGLGFV